MPYLNRNNMKLFYETLGNPDGDAILLVMGISGQLINWPKPFLDSLSKQGYCVIVFDNRDVGLSQYFDEAGAPTLAEVIQAKQSGDSLSVAYTLKDMAHDISLLLDGLRKERAHIVGLSMGGMIAQLFALNYAERVNSLSLIATSCGDPNLPSAKPEITEFLMNPKKSSSSSIDSHVKQYQLYNHPNDFNEEEVRALHEKAYARAYHPEGVQRQLLAMLSTEPFYEDLHKITCPTRIIHGDYDPVFNLAHAEYMAQKIPNAKLAVINELGHGIPIRFSKDISDNIVENCKLAVKY